MNQKTQDLIDSKIHQHEQYFLSHMINEWEGTVNLNEKELCFDRYPFEIRIKRHEDTIENIESDVPFIIMDKDIIVYDSTKQKFQLMLMCAIPYSELYLRFESRPSKFSIKVKYCDSNKRADIIKKYAQSDKTIDGIYSYDNGVIRPITYLI